ncbi:A-kinase anchor protein 13 isoform X7 [Ictalurus punctatus]|uniref:A-kinase anchor protein 13 isoform X7 n=1 Tax=Ictalurus punctatus TaxID=7998 RepID=A0A9F7RCL6_ICTPU|nr:A-kinase anchor protein 13 isoform X7 [Ictalurus punctatus]
MESREAAGGSRKQLQSFPLILSRDFVCDSPTAVDAPSEDPSLQKPPVCELQEVYTEKEQSESAKCANGSTQSEGGDAPASSGGSGSGKRTSRLEGEGVSGGKQEDCAVVSGVSCREQQQQEEVDSELRAIREALRTQRSHALSETQTHSKIQSGNTQAGTMGQTQGLLPEHEEKNKTRGDFPEEREGERNSGQETSLSSENTPSPDGQTSSKSLSHFHLNLDVNAAEKGKEIPIRSQETGSSIERIHESTSCTTREQDISEDLLSLSFRPNMAPGPVHNVRLEPPPLVDAAAGHPIHAPPETASGLSEQVSSDSVKQLPPRDVTDPLGEPDGLVLGVPLTTEVSGGVDQTLPPETEESSSPGSMSGVQPVVSLEISEETSQIFNESHCGGEEPPQEGTKPQSDAKDAQITDTVDPNRDPVRSQSPPLVLDRISTLPPGLTVSDSNPDETGSGSESKLEREPLSFQTPPESPCEFFSVDGFITTSDSLEPRSASLELGRPAGSSEIVEAGEKVETELLGMCESSKKSPLTILCGSFSKLTIRGSPLDPHLDDTTSETIETKEEVTKLEPNLVQQCERSEAPQIVSNMSVAPPCDFVSKENLRGTAVITYAVGSEAQNDQPSESKDVQEEWMKMPTQLGEDLEILSLPCEALSPSTAVSQNITDPHSEVITFEEGINKTSEDPQTELTTSTETLVESLGPHLEVGQEHLEAMNFEEIISRTCLDLHHDLITCSEETIVEISLDPFPEVKISEESIQDQQLKVTISEESIRGTSLGPNHDLTSSVENTGEVSLGTLLEVTSPEESVQVQQLDESGKDYDPKHEFVTFEESIRGMLDFPHDLITPSEETIREMSFEVPEVNSSEENVLDQQPEVTTSKKSKNGTSQDPKLEVTTSEKSIQGPRHEAMIKETVFDQQPEITAFEESIRETPYHTKLEETMCEEDLWTSLKPPPEFMNSKMDTSFPEAPFQSQTAILDRPVYGNDSDLALESVSISDQPMDLSFVMDLDSGTGLGMDAVEVDSGLIQEVPPLDNVGVCKIGTLEEEKRHMVEEDGEEPKEERVAGDDGRPETALTHTDQRSEIHREEQDEVYCLDSEDLKQECSKENTGTDVPVAVVCRSVSATSLPGSESVSDGDSLLGPDTMDDTVFKQSEDTLTLTSGISTTGSVSTDDSSTAHAAGGPEEEEKKDRLMEVLERSALLRPTSRSQSPSRRHSWGPSKNPTGETDMGQRSVVQGEVGEKPAGHRRSMSWCPSHVPHSEMDEMNSRSYSLEGLAAEDEVKMPSVRLSTHSSMMEREERGSLASLTEEENESNAGDNSSLDSQRSVQDVGCGFVPPPHTLTKSVSMSAISPRDLDAIGRARPKRRISFSFSMSPRLLKPKPLFAFGSSSSDEEEAGNLTCASSAAGSQEYSISEEDPAPLRSDSEVRGTKVSRTFSYLKSKMSKKSKEKDRDKNKDGKEKKSSNGHLFSSTLTPPSSPCLQCSRPISTKDAVTCTNCNVHVHKGCRDALPVCAKVKMKQQSVTDSAPPPGLLSRGKSASARERPWSTFLLPEDQASPLVAPPRKNSSIMPFNSGALSKSISISNIAGQLDEAPLKALRILSQSTDSLHKMGKVNESTESLTDEGTELMDGHLMAEFEADVKELEADSWSFTVDKKYLKQLKKDVIKRQDVIYELIQTEMHHLRTLRIMADVYSKGLQKEVQVEVQTLEKMFPVLEELLELHTHFLTHLLERRREAQRGNDGGFVIRRIGDVLLDQVTGSNAENMKKVYGKFCSRHNEAVNVYKELHTRDKRFQAFIKKKMSSAVVRRLSIPECILLVTQRITKYPVLLQRLLQHTREPEEEQADVAEALRQVKEVLTGVDSKVNEYEKRRRLKEVYSRTDSKSIMRMKSGQMFAREDLIRGRKLLHDGPLQLKNVAGRLKDVQALLLSDVFVFLQEKDQKYVFASLDQRSTVISLQKLIVREVANEERGLFFITAGIERPEMVEVHASTKDERNTWMQLIQNATNSIDKDDDEGIPSENEEDKRLQESKAKEMRDHLQKKDEQIVTLLEEKVRLFRELCDCANQDGDSLHNRMLFRATGDDVTKGEPIIKDALKEVGTLQELVNSSVVGQQVCVGQEDSSVCAGPVSLPRRAETFGGFDCHQMNISKNGDREEADDLRRTESDSVLKKGGTASLLLLHKRNSEQVLQSVTHLHDLLSTLQAVVVQQDTFIEEQRQALSSLSLRQPSVSSSSSVSSLSSCSSRPSSLMEQEKHRQEEKVREEERRRREEDDRKRREEEEVRRRREEELALREERLVAVEEETQRRREALEQEQQDLDSRREEYQRELLRLRDDQRRLEREKEQLHSQQHNTEPDSVEQRRRTSSTASEDTEGVEVFSRADSKRKAKNLNPFSSGSGHKGGATEPHGQIPTRLLQLTKPRDKKEKKKKKGKGGQQNQATETLGAAAPEPSAHKDVYFC